MSTIEKAVEALGKKDVNPGSVANDRTGEPVLSPQDFIAERLPPNNEINSQQSSVGAVQLSEPPCSEETHTAGPSAGQIKNSTSVEIPFDRFLEEGMITPSDPRSQIAEEFRTIKRPLLMNMSGESAAPIPNSNLLMVTSALQGDGKTFCAINLALSIAMEQDKTVLFIDSDISQATAGKVLNIPPGCPGLTDVLENRGLSVSDVMLPTNIQNFRVIPAGNVHQRSTELLASSSMLRLMEELSHRYNDRVVVFDSPPLLQTTEASVLTNAMGQIVFVVSAESTPQHAVTEALSRIADEKVVGLVLNRYKHYRGSKYTYGYGYGYGQRAKSPAGASM